MVVGHSAPSASSVILQISRIAPQGRSRCRYSTRTWVEYIAVQGHKVCQLLNREVGALCPVPLPACRVELQRRRGSHEVYSLAQCRQRPPGRSRATRSSAEIWSFRLKPCRQVLLAMENDAVRLSSRKPTALIFLLKSLMPSAEFQCDVELVGC